LRIKYSPDARDRLKQLKEQAGVNVVGKITKGVRNLSDNPRQCPSVENMLGIPCPYYFLHIERNYVFYRMDDDVIYITDIYNEREDFMWEMFGVRLRTQESIDYWGE
jgi:plasmid stabilization system protein ParE